jgi:hypothetical protein
MFGMVNILRLVLHKMEHLNFGWAEVTGSCQDGSSVADAKWSLVSFIKICV